MRRLFFPLLASILVLVACQKEETATPSSEPSNTTLITDRATLDQMMTYTQAPIELKGAEKSALQINEIASVSSPVVNGVKLSATSIFIRNNVAYVTYHERGEGFGGAFRAFDITNANAPLPIYELALNDYDLNASDISTDGTRLYLAGGSNKKGAVLVIFNLNTAGIPSTTSQQVLEFSNAASANGVIQGGQWIYVSAGHTNGGLFAFRKSNLQFIGEDLYDGASFSTSNGRATGQWHMALEGGDNAQLHVYKIGSVDQADEWVLPVGSVLHQNVEPEYEYFGKGTIFCKPNGNVVYMAMGMYGMKAVSFFTGDLVYESPSNMITYGNTNGVSADNDYIYLANGAQGLYIYEPGIGTQLDLVGYWDDDTAQPASANFVQSNGSNIFVAYGKEGGLKILSKP